MTDDYIAQILENTRKYMDSMPIDAHPNDLMIKALKGELPCKHGFWGNCSSCMGPKYHWYNFFTRWILQECIGRLFKRSKHWNIQGDEDDPFNPWYWRLARRPLIRAFTDHVFPIIRSFFPSLIAKDIVSVQPMDAHSVEHLRYTWDVLGRMKASRGVDLRTAGPIE